MFTSAIRKINKTPWSVCQVPRTTTRHVSVLISLNAFRLFPSPLSPSHPCGFRTPIPVISCAVITAARVQTLRRRRLTVSRRFPTLSWRRSGPKKKTWGILRHCFKNFTIGMQMADRQKCFAEKSQNKKWLFNRWHLPIFRTVVSRKIASSIMDFFQLRAFVFLFFFYENNMYTKR